MSEGNVSTTPTPKPPVRDLETMPMVFHGSTINAIDTTEGRVFELDGQRHGLLGNAIKAAREKKKAADEKAAKNPPPPAPEVNDGNSNAGNA